MVRRNLHERLLEVSRYYPVVTLTGPRQSGKTTLCQMAFPDKLYVTLESPDHREFAQNDPRGFLNQYASGAIVDEVQRVPDLASHIQEDVDKTQTPGRFILTGSANFALMQSVSQSLAGRTALLNLFPLSLDEIRLFKNTPGDLFSTLHFGGYPAIFDRSIPPGEWQRDYVGTYIERDVRQILNVTDLNAFQTFLKLCAGRTGQLLNLSKVGADCGITHNTARSWLSVLEAGYIVFRLPPFHSNLTKRLVKTPKLHFYDSGLLCYLLGIQNATQLWQHPLRGEIFESWVISEILKARVHRGHSSDFHFFRNRKGVEMDLVLKGENALVLAEIKSGQTIASDFFTAFDKLEGIFDSERSGRQIEKRLIYGGHSPQQRSTATVVPWSKIHEHPWI